MERQGLGMSAHLVCKPFCRGGIDSFAQHMDAVCERQFLILLLLEVAPQTLKVADVCA